MSSKIELTNANGKTLSLTNSDSLLVDKNVIYLDAVGTINVAGGLLKNDIAYANP